MKQQIEEIAELNFVTLEMAESYEGAEALMVTTQWSVRVSEMATNVSS